MDAKTLLFGGLGVMLLMYSVVVAGGGLAMPTALETAIGFVTAFFDTLGIGSFATTTAAYKLRKMVPVKQIPGTLNGGHALSTIAQALIHTTPVTVHPVPLIPMIVAAPAGSWVGVGVVVHWPRRKIQIGMGIALFGAAALFCLTPSATPPGALAPLVGDPNRSAAARLELLRAAEDRVTEAPSQGEAAIAELMSGAPLLRTRYLVLGPLGQLARPLLRVDLQQLGQERRGDIEAQQQRRHRHTPAGRIASAARARPVALHLDLHLRAFECTHTPVGRDEGAGTVHIDRAVATAQAIEHELTAIGELQAKPVPAGLIRGEPAAAPFAVEPCQTVNRRRDPVLQ